MKLQSCSRRARQTHSEPKVLKKNFGKKNAFFKTNPDDFSWGGGIYANRLNTHPAGGKRKRRTSTLRNEMLTIDQKLTRNRCLTLNKGSSPQHGPIQPLAEAQEDRGLSALTGGWNWMGGLLQPSLMVPWRVCVWSSLILQNGNLMHGERLSNS